MPEADLVVSTEERIDAELRQVVDELGGWPSNTELRRRGRMGPAKAIIRYGGSTYWARRLGYEPFSKAELTLMTSKPPWLFGNSR